MASAPRPFRKPPIGSVFGKLRKFLRFKERQTLQERGFTNTVVAENHGPVRRSPVTIREIQGLPGPERANVLHGQGEEIRAGTCSHRLLAGNSSFTVGLCRLAPGHFLRGHDAPSALSCDFEETTSRRTGRGALPRVLRGSVPPVLTHNMEHRASCNLEARCSCDEVRAYAVGGAASIGSALISIGTANPSALINVFTCSTGMPVMSSTALPFWLRTSTLTTTPLGNTVLTEL